MDELVQLATEAGDVDDSDQLEADGIPDATEVLDELYEEDPTDGPHVTLDRAGARRTHVSTLEGRVGARISFAIRMTDPAGSPEPTPEREPAQISWDDDYDAGAGRPERGKTTVAGVSVVAAVSRRRGRGRALLAVGAVFAVNASGGGAKPVGARRRRVAADASLHGGRPSSGVEAANNWAAARADRGAAEPVRGDDDALVIPRGRRADGAATDPSVALAAYAAARRIAGRSPMCRRSTRHDRGHRRDRIGSWQPRQHVPRRERRRPTAIIERR